MGMANNEEIVEGEIIEEDEAGEQRFELFHEQTSPDDPRLRDKMAVDVEIERINQQMDELESRRARLITTRNNI